MRESDGGEHRGEVDDGAATGKGVVDISGRRCGRYGRQRDGLLSDHTAKNVFVCQVCAAEVNVANQNEFSGASISEGIIVLTLHDPSPSPQARGSEASPTRFRGLRY